MSPARSFAGLAERWSWTSAVDRPLDADGPSRPWDAHVIDDRPIFDVFKEVVKRAPRATAILYDDEGHMSFDDLFAKARSLAAVIGEKTVSGDRIAIVMSSGPEYPAAVLACLAVGRLFSPLDARFPAIRNAAVFTDFQPACVICAHDATEIRRSLPQAAIIDTRDVETTACLDEDDTPLSQDIDDPAFVIYTSGSSGRPKGIVNGQRALLQRVRQQVHSVHAGPGDTVICLASPCTIAGMREMLAALLCGASLRMIDPEGMGLREARRLIGLGGTLVYAVPTLIRALCGNGGASSDFASLRVVRLGGEKVSWDDIANLRRVLSPGALIQIGYSSTETTGSQRFVAPDEVPFGSAPSVGWLLPGIEYAVLDEADRDVEDGEDGELVLRSHFVALGQWRDGRCDSTGYESDEDGARVFRTGDIVRIEAGGCMRVLGRRDRQIKINGRRVEPDEIEAALRSNDGVREAVVVPIGAARDTSIVGFLVASGTGAGDLVARVRSDFAMALPAAWCPARLHVLSELPRLPGGKLDIIALRAFDEACLAERSCDEPTAPTDALEEIVAKAWTITLGKNPSGCGFQEAGGDSLRLLRLVFEIEEATRSRVKLDQLRMDMNVSAIASALREDDASLSQREVRDERPPVLLLPGLNGDSPSLASFRTDLEKHFRFVVADYPSWRTMVRTDCSLETISNAAMAAVVAAMPVGVVRIAGYSLGGAVGYDIARRLTEAGRTIEWFVVLDTNVEADRHQRSVRGMLWTVWTIVASLRRRESALDRVACAFAIWLTRPINRRKLLWLIDNRIVECLPASLRFPLEMQICELLQQRAFDGWVREARSERLPGRAYVIRSQERRRTLDPRLGWGRFFDKVTVRDVEGDHREMLRLPYRGGLVRGFLSLVGSRSGDTVLPRS